MADQKSYTYDAFISYRHTEPDKKVAEKLHRMLETYKVPRSIVRLSGKRKIQRVFRDRDELPTSSNLADNILKALETSEYLIVICSPRTPQSQWVLKEIEDFKALHGPDKILALLIEGEPQESFPHQLRFINKTETLDDGTVRESTCEIEPLAADIRASNEKEMLKKLRTEILRLLSPMLKCKYDDLRQRHRERLIRNILTASVSASAFFLAFGSFSTYQALLINQKSQEVMQKSHEVELKNQEVLAQIKQTQISQSRYLADISNQLYEEGDRYRAILAGLEALPKDLDNPERPYIPEAEFALAQALHVYDADDTPDMDIVLDHTKDVCFMEMSPDGKKLLTASDDGVLNTWDVETGKKLTSINAGDISLFDYQAFFFDDTSIITPAGETTSCFDINGNLKWQNDEYSYKMALSPDHKLLASDFNDTIGISDAATGKLLISIVSSEQVKFNGDGVYINNMAFSKASEFLAVAVSNGTVYILDTSSGALKRTLKTGYSNISSLEFAQDDSLIVASYDFDQENMVFGKGTGSLMVFPPEGSVPGISLDFPDSMVEKAAIHTFNPSWVVLVESEKLHVIDLKTGETIYTFIHGDKVTDYKVFDTFILSSSSDGTIRFLMTQAAGYEYDYARMTFPSPIKGMVHGKGKFAIYYPQSNKVYLMKYLENDKIVKLEGHNDYIGNGCFSSDGKKAVTFDMDSEGDEEIGLICLWDAESRTLLKKEILGETIKETKFIDGDSKLFIWTKSNKALILDASDLSTLYQYPCDDYVRSVEYNPELSCVALSTYNEIIVCSLKDLKVMSRIEENADSFTFSSNNPLLVTCNPGAKLYDALSGEAKLTYEDDKVSGGTISPDGKLVALAYKDKTIKIFMAGTALSEAFTLKENRLNITKLVFSPDSKTLFVGYEDNSIAFYDAQTGVLLNTYNGEHFSSPLEKVVFITSGNRFACLDNSGNGLIFDAASFKVLAAAPILDIDQNFETILSRYDYNVLFMPVYTTRMLLDEAKEQLNGRVLTEEEKKTLFIE